MLTKEQCREIAFKAQSDWAVNAPGTLRLAHAIADALHAAMVEERESNLRRVVAELRFTATVARSPELTFTIPVHEYDLDSPAQEAIDGN